MAAGKHVRPLQGQTYRPPSGQNGRCGDAKNAGFNVADSFPAVIGTIVISYNGH